ncbi:MAG: hypothetical protein KBS75_09760 [Bacteroidales bacterium]|nr:hypothetical protein [Candidatus Equimonas faecalis]
MKKFLSFFTLAFLMMAGAWAAEYLGSVKRYDQLSNGMKIALKCCSQTNGGYLYLTTGKVTSKADFDNTCTFVLEDAGNGKFKLKSESTGNYIGNNASVVSSTSATAFTLQNPSTNFNGDTSLTENINECTRFADGTNFLNCQNLGTDAKFANGTGAWSFFKVYEVVENYSLVILGPNDAKVTYNGIEYTTGQTLSTTGLTSDDIHPAFIPGYTASVSVSSTNITVVYTALPFKVSTSATEGQAWYTIDLKNINGDDRWIYQNGSNASQLGKVKASTTVLTADNWEDYAFCFVADIENEGYKIYAKKNGLGITINNDNDHSPVLVSSAPSTVKVFKQNSDIYFGLASNKLLSSWSTNDSYVSICTTNYFTGARAVITEVPDFGLKISIGETGYTTFCYNACYAKPADVKAYYCVESPNPDMLTLVEWDKDYLWKQMPYILKGSPNTIYTFEKYNETTIPEENKEEDEAAKTANVLKGIAGDKSMDTELVKTIQQSTHIYVLSKVDGTMGFYNFGGSTLAAHKAFYAPKNTTKVNGFILDFGGLTEGVSTVMGATNLKAGFDIQGRRINKMQKGINILNGQKIIK